METVRLNADVDVETAKRLKHILVDEGSTFSEWLRRQIDEYVGKKEAKGTKAPGNRQRGGGNDGRLEAQCEEGGDLLGRLLCLGEEVSRGGRSEPQGRRSRAWEETRGDPGGAVLRPEGLPGDDGADAVPVG